MYHINYSSIDDIAPAHVPALIMLSRVYFGSPIMVPTALVNKDAVAYAAVAFSAVRASPSKFIFV